MYKKLITATIAVALAFAGATPAMAAGSDGATPYTVSTSGITLPAGTTFEANGHVNVKISRADKSGTYVVNTHFDPNNNQPGGAYIGKDFLPVNLAPGECIVWVQLSLYNEHFGEGGQSPVCAPVVVVEPPVVEPPVVVPPVVVDTKETKTLKWLIPNNVNPNTSNKIWPQTPYTTEACGTGWIQVDKYRYGTAEERAIVDALDDDGFLTFENGKYEDSAVVLWSDFEQQKPCPPVDTTPTPVVAPTLTVLPPTCEAAGTLPFLNNPAAQNPNGYEFPGLGYRVYISPAFTGAGTYEATIQKVGPGFDPAFPNGTKVSGETKQTLVVLPAIGFQTGNPASVCYNRPEAPVKDAKVFVSHTDELSCEMPTGFITTSTVTYTYVWNEDTKSYDESSTTKDTYEGINLTEAETVACIEVPPVPVVTAPVDDAPTASEPVSNRLASTGVDFGPLGVFLVLVIALGAALVFVGRTRND